MNIDKQIITDLFEIIKSQNVVISYLVSTDTALVNTLVNTPELPFFAVQFQNNHAHAATHPEGKVVESLLQLQRMLVAIGEKLKADIGGWNN
jgi:hypothetical protein